MSNRVRRRIFVMTTENDIISLKSILVSMCIAGFKSSQKIRTETISRQRLSGYSLVVKTMILNAEHRKTILCALL